MEGRIEMTKRKMYLKMILSSFIRRKSRMVVALLAVIIGATIMSGLITIDLMVPTLYAFLMKGRLVKRNIINLKNL